MWAMTSTAAYATTIVMMMCRLSIT